MRYENLTLEEALQKMSDLTGVGLDILESVMGLRRIGAGEVALADTQGFCIGVIKWNLQNEVEYMDAVLDVYHYGEGKACMDVGAGSEGLYHVDCEWTRGR